MASLPIRREFWGPHAFAGGDQSSYSAPAGLRFGCLTIANFIAPHAQGITEVASGNGGFDLRPNLMVPAMVDYGNWLDSLTIEATVSGYWEDSTYSYDVPSQTLTWTFTRVGQLRALVEQLPADPEGEPGDWAAQLSAFGTLDWDNFTPLLCCNDNQRAGAVSIGSNLRRSLDWLRPTPFFVANAVLSPSGVPAREYDRTRTELDPPEGEDPEVVEQTPALGFSNQWWPRFYYSGSYDQLGAFDAFWVDQDTTTWSVSQWRDLRRTYSAFIDGEGEGVDIDLTLTIS